MKPLRQFPLGLFLLAAGLGGARLALAADSAPSDGSIVELPKFEIVDSRLLPPPESWHYAELPGFEILSGISARETKRFVRDFLLLQEVIEAIMPGIARGQTGVPTALVLCGSGNGFEAFLPAARAEERFSTNNLFFTNTERCAIVVDFALGELQIAGDESIEADPYRAFYSAYFRFLIRQQVRNAPAWFEEGLVQIFAAMEFDRKTITFAQIGDGFGAAKTGDFNRLLARRGLLSFPDLFADPPPERDALWSAQAYAFTHLCLYGENKRYQKGFVQFVQRLGHEPLTEELFKECFKKNYNDMGNVLRSYLEFTVHTATQFNAKKGKGLPEPPAVALREATQAEVGRIKGEVLRLGGHDEAAHTALITPYVRGERDPRLLAALGLDERAAGHDDRALKFLESAITANVVRPRVYLEFARLRFNAARAQPAAAGEKLDERQVAEIVKPLLIARSQPPPMAEVYTLLAEVWTRSAQAPTRESLDTLVEGIRLFPRDLDLLWQGALFASNRGFPDAARTLALRGEKLANTPDAKNRFNVLAGALQRDAATPSENKPISVPALP